MLGKDLTAELCTYSRSKARDKASCRKDEKRQTGGDHCRAGLHPHPGPVRLRKKTKENEKYEERLRKMTSLGSTIASSCEIASCQPPAKEKQIREVNIRIRGKQKDMGRVEKAKHISGKGGKRENKKTRE